MHPLSTIIFNPDTTDEANRLLRELEKFLHDTRNDRIEFRQIERPCSDPDGSAAWESTLYVIVHTGNLLGMIADLTEAGML